MECVGEVVCTAHPRPPHPGSLEAKLQGPGSGCDLKSERPDAFQRSLDTPEAAWGLASSPLFLRFTTTLPLHVLSIGPPFHSRPSNFSFLCLSREGWLHCNPVSYPLPPVSRPSPDADTHSPDLLSAWPSNPGYPETGLEGLGYASPAPQWAIFVFIR